jgi:UDP-3-O-[3-hydroxymyristoyl] glucosamine N-acyltransferase
LSFISEHNEKYKNFRPLQQSIPFSEEMYDPKCNVRIGAGTILYPNVIIYDNVTIGKNCVIDSGAVIGAEGFSTRLEDGKAIRMKNVGGVTIGDEVEIGANTCIDRASLEGWNTVIYERVKIDNLCHIAHNVIIHHDVRIAPMVCIGGSTVIGTRVWISIGCSIREHLWIQPDAEIQMGSVVIADVERGQVVAGHYATDSEKWKRLSKLTHEGML